MTAFEAARDIELGGFSSWLDAERIAVNVNTLYREFNKSSQRTEIIELFRQMAELAGYRDNGVA
jgi:hypothetical protein